MVLKRHQTGTGRDSVWDLPWDRPVELGESSLRGRSGRCPRCGLGRIATPVPPRGPVAAARTPPTRDRCYRGRLAGPASLRAGTLPAMAQLGDQTLPGPETTVQIRVAIQEAEDVEDLEEDDEGTLAQAAGDPARYLSPGWGSASEEEPSRGHR